MTGSETTHVHALEAELKRAFTQAPVTVASAYLFGSEAEGRAHSESDIDVGILLPPEAPGGAPATAKEIFEQRVRLTSWLIGILHRNDVDVVILNDAPPLLARRIVTAGRRVFCHDGGADHAFVRDVQLRAADLEPFLRRAREVKLVAMRR